MKKELSYVLLTPASLRRERTGSIISRLLYRTKGELIGAQVVAFNEQQAKNYSELLQQTLSSLKAPLKDLTCNYVLENLGKNANGNRRSLLLLFAGENICEELNSIVGELKLGESNAGLTIRDSYAEALDLGNGSFVFEPAVLTPLSASTATKELEFIKTVASNSANIVEQIEDTAPDAERTLLIIKPENWRNASCRPGNILDLLSGTNLKMIGCKLYRMSVAEALEFYGPVEDALKEKLAPSIAEKAKVFLEAEMNLPLPDEAMAGLIQAVGVPHAYDNFVQIVEFMSGSRPQDCHKDDWDKPNKAKCLVVIFEGVNAIAKIREAIGPTNPAKASGGTVRKDFGTDIMVNAVHASDSPDSVKREMKIVKITKNDLADFIK